MFQAPSSTHPFLGMRGPPHPFHHAPVLIPLSSLRSLAKHLRKKSQQARPSCCFCRQPKTRTWLCDWIKDNLCLKEDFVCNASSEVCSSFRAPHKTCEGGFQQRQPVLGKGPLCLNNKATQRWTNSKVKHKEQGARSCSRSAPH